MLNYRVITGVLGAILFIFGIIMLIPMMVGLAYGEESWWSFGGTGVLGIIIGIATWNYYRPDEELRVREAFAILGGTWVLICLLGALPFVWSDILNSFTDAYFEMVSGFTGTGATIFGAGSNPKLEEVPHAFLFWRAFSQWLGGFAIIVLGTALLPLLGIGGMQLFKGEVSGPAIKRLSFRFREIARRMAGLYLLLTIIQALLLLPVMDFFDAVCHAFSTISTGGFSTKTQSIAAFNSIYAEVILVIFMFIGAINFNFLYQFLAARNVQVFKRQVFIIFTSLCFVGSLLVSLAIYKPVAEYFPPLDPSQNYVMYDNIGEALRYGFFQVFSIATTTGFTNVDYTGWMSLCLFVFMMLSIVGGMAGSTAGGIKVLRVLLMFKQIGREITLLIHPKAIVAIRLEHEVIAPEILRNVTAFVAAFLVSFVLGTALMTFCGIDVMAASSLVISALSGVGPTLGALGAGESYATLPEFGKWLLSFLMLLGRLEIFTLVLLLIPSYWKR